MNVPSAVRNLRGEGQLHVQWLEGPQVLDHVCLRGACPCSRCRASRLQGAIAWVAQDVRVVHVVPQGYGLQLVFSDGHDRGIFPWSYLRDLG
ncbi:DUF971 domain-containing protein [Pseudomonas entomophila]|uniref:Gamma-butyrobetaine hydroxylase-like N-terminal domain-containing protein n=2 Tax=Pseudomonas entomophila TaxID=312306 RepID=Q1IGQ0_PSEE4|nr:gamma-butyrobetaine hydroxylase-like domain-containing protein [Pseudomonas entomophila]WMW05999.1 gamma-butyrobetaine hydroxylase-like domain-containing protein [Pseudomonas entomophila]CAK13152.1 conserved hypothetical protein [Pseudomonas entomophila L48]